MKHKYLEALNRKLSWERQTFISARNFGLKGFMCSAWRGQGLRPGGKWVNIDGLDKSRDGQQYNARGIEDVEQSAFDKLLNNNDGLYERVRAKSRVWYESVSNATNPVLKSTAVHHDTPYQTNHGEENFQNRNQVFQSQKPTEPDLEYEIDPITNRKVFRKKASEKNRKPIEVPVKNFRGYRSQFQDFAPPTSQPTEAEFKTRVPPDCSSETAGGFSVQSDPVGREQVSSNRKECSVQKDLTKYDARTSYGSAFYRETDGNLPEEVDSVRENLKTYEEKHPVGPVFYREPDGKLPEQPENIQENLDENETNQLHGPVQYKDPGDTLPEKPYTVQEGLKDYDNRVAYGAVTGKESGGNATSTGCSVQNGLSDYDSRIHYGTPTHNESSGRAPPKRKSQSETLREYGPRGISNNTPLDSERGTDKSFRYPNEDAKEDLDLLRASDVRAASGIIKGAKIESEEEKLAMRRKLEDDFQRQQDLYSSRCGNKSSAEVAKQTDALETKSSTLRERQKLVEELQIENIELRNLQAHLSGKVESELANVSAEMSSVSAPRSMTGNFVRDFPEEFETKWTSTPESGGLKPENGIASKAIEPLPQSSFARNSNTPRIQTSLDRSVSEIGATQDLNESLTLQNEIDRYSKVSGGHGNEHAEENAREEEKARKLRLQNEKDPSLSRKSEVPETTHGEEVTPQFEEERSARKVAQQKKKNLMKQMDVELVRKIRSIYEENYGTLDSKHRQVADQVSTSKLAGSNISEFTEAPEPTLYKILAYDPTMQEINTAETSSIVPDSASALTPAEVLLRLSNPSKFFPHFQPLQAEGYEIVSGSGDVLVFRKVRPAGPSGSKSESASIQDRKRTNPIDGMQSIPFVATGNFASPTGFVNHDLPVSEAPFKSNIDVRREEPVFSGKSNWQEDSQSTRRQGKGWGKRLLVGGAWLAGCSYAIGVVAEFFRTGGIDGHGPQGF
jgi:hypothetical protein